MKYTLISFLAFLAAASGVAAREEALLNLKPIARTFPHAPAPEVEKALWASKATKCPQLSPFIKMNRGGRTCKKKCMAFGLAVSSSGMNCVNQKTVKEGWAQADTDCSVFNEDFAARLAPYIHMNANSTTCKKQCDKIAEIFTFTGHMKVSDDGLACVFKPL